MSLSSVLKSQWCRVLHSCCGGGLFDILLLEACGTIEVQLETGRDYQDVIETHFSQSNLPFAFHF